MFANRGSECVQQVGLLIGHDGPIDSIRFTDDAKYCLTAGHDRTVRLWNPLRLDSRHEALPMHAYRSGHVHGVTCVSNHDTTLLSASDKTLIVTDMVNAKVKQRLSGAHLGRINDVDLRNDVVYISASYDGTVKLWDARNLQRYTPIQSCEEAKDSVTSVILDGPHSFYSSSIDGNIRLYDIRQGRITCCNVGSPIIYLSVADDCIAASCLDGTIRLLEKDLGELLNTYHTAHSASQYAVQCAITSRYVVTGSEESGTDAVVYDLVTAKAQQILRDEKMSNGPTCAIDAQDNCIVTASYNGNALVWTSDTSQIVYD
mmetsp:Transcript_11298/g.17319  ORF Transcript_11298/g.17319 Transcript_11298/m.17319 type:complete len:316 (+) Transcript_11298:87-1034(+)